MNRLAFALCSLTITCVSGTTVAQTIDINVNGGWTLNSSSSVGPVEVRTNFDPPNIFPCQSTDSNSAEIDYDIRLVPGSGVINHADIAAKYAGSNHAGCVLEAVSASASASGYAAFVHSSTGEFQLDISSNQGGNDSGAHASGYARSDFSINLAGALYTPPSFSLGYNQTRSNFAYIDGAGTLTTNDFAAISTTKSGRNRFTVTVSVEGSASVHLPSALDSAFATTFASTNSNSSITLRD